MHTTLEKINTLQIVSTSTDACGVDGWVVRSQWCAFRTSLYGSIQPLVYWFKWRMRLSHLCTSCNSLKQKKSLYVIISDLSVISVPLPNCQILCLPTDHILFFFLRQPYTMNHDSWLDAAYFVMGVLITQSILYCLVVIVVFSFSFICF